VKVIQHVRENMTCRTCEAIAQPPAPSHPIARGRAGPQLLADVLFGKYGAHLPLNRQSEIYGREGVELDTSTLADWVGACAATLMPPRDAIEAHVHAAERLHVDDTTVPVLAKGKCRLAVRHERSRPLVGELERWLESERRKLSSKNPLAKAIDYSLKRWSTFTRFLDDGRICMTNNAA
jgi:hypothetical protein